EGDRFGPAVLVDAEGDDRRLADAGLVGAAVDRESLITGRRGYDAGVRLGPLLLELADVDLDEVTIDQVDLDPVLGPSAGEADGVGWNVAVPTALHSSLPIVAEAGPPILGQSFDLSGSLPSWRHLVNNWWSGRSSPAR